MVRAVKTNCPGCGAGWTLVAGGLQASLYNKHLRRCMRISLTEAFQIVGEALAVEQQDFEKRFEAAFNELDRESGGRNYVKISQVRAKLGMPREAFDAGLNELRQKRRFSAETSEGSKGDLSASDFADGLSSGVVTSGRISQGESANLVYVSRRRS